MARMGCPSGFKLVNGKCVDASGSEASYPYVSPKGAMYTDSKSMVSGTPSNPRNPANKQYVDKIDRSKLSPEQIAALGLRKKGGATKKYEAGGMTESESCGKPGKPRCKKTFKSKGKSKETKGSLLGTIGAGLLGGLGGYAAYKKYKEQQKGGATKYQKGGSTQDKKMADLAKRGAGPVPKSTVDGYKWAKNTKAPNAKKYQNGGSAPHGPGSMTHGTVPPMMAKPDSEKTPKEKRQAKRELKKTLKYVSKNGSGYNAPAGVKMKTGGMVNPNANLKATATAGSKGVKSGVNPKAAASKVARGRSGGTSVAPKKATPGRK